MEITVDNCQEYYKGLVKTWNKNHFTHRKHLHLASVRLQVVFKSKYSHKKEEIWKKKPKVATRYVFSISGYIWKMWSSTLILEEIKVYGEGVEVQEAGEKDGEEEEKKRRERKRIWSKRRRRWRPTTTRIYNSLMIRLIIASLSWEQCIMGTPSTVMWHLWRQWIIDTCSRFPTTIHQNLFQQPALHSSTDSKHSSNTPHSLLHDISLPSQVYPPPHTHTHIYTHRFISAGLSAVCFHYFNLRK